MNFIEKTQRYLLKTEKILLIILVSFMTAASFFQVIIRLFLGRSVLWLDPMLRYIVLWTGFLGASLAAYENKHFALDFITKNISSKNKKIITALNKLFTGSVCAVLMYAAIKFVKIETEFETVLFSIGQFEVRSIYAEFMIPLGFGLIIFHTLAGMLKNK